MSNLPADSQSLVAASELHTDELLRNLRRFPAGVLPVGVLRELQSRGDTIHESLVKLLVEAVESVHDGLQSKSESVFFAFTLFVPLATNDDRPLIETLLTLPDGAIRDLLGDLVIEAMPRLIAKFFRHPSATEVVEWIERVADHEKLPYFCAFPLFRSMSLAVALGDLDRTIAIEALCERLKKRSDRRFDQQSAQIVCELMDLSASNMEAVDAMVRSCFEHDQIDTDYVDIESWNDLATHGRIRVDERTWTDSAEELITWCYDFVSDELDPVNAIYRVNVRASRGSSLEESTIDNLVDELRRSSDQYFPRDAFESLDRAFADAYQAIIHLIRDELGRYEVDSESWSGNGAYLGLVLTVANRMPLPPDLLQSILRMSQEDREKVFGDQFDLIVQAVALTPLPQADFVEQWIWDADRNDADRRDMIDFYLFACQDGPLDRKVAVDALAAGLRRALIEEPNLIAPYAHNLAFLPSKEHFQVLDEALKRDDIEQLLPIQELRRMMQDAQFANEQFRQHWLNYRTASRIISEGVMFDEPVNQEKLHIVKSPASSYQPPADVVSTITIRNEDRTPRNAPCPCGSGKKFKKCCLNK